MANEATTSLTDLRHRVTRLEQRADHRDAEIGELRVDVSGLKAWRDEARSRHSNTPAWLFGSLSIVGSLIWAGLTLYLSGGGGP